uniref:C-type lectin domain-containing protein n=1 Tax=Poecilia reticulata TaxID=8081 RepID=A0A3P9NEB2_POERE
VDLRHNGEDLVGSLGSLRSVSVTLCFQSGIKCYFIKATLTVEIFFYLSYVPDLVMLSTCLHLQPVYHFVNQSLNWTEAQTYCRQTHTDLATVLSSEEKNRFMSTLSSAGHRSDVWIGLFNEIDWRWSDGFTGSGADYRHWRTSSNEPSFHYAVEFCVIFQSWGIAGLSSMNLQESYSMCKGKC